MRALFFFSLVLTSSACAALSGLDSLEVSDGGAGVDANVDVAETAADATGTDATDASDVKDAQKDGDDASDGSDASDAGTSDAGVPCGQATCNGQTPVCCVTIANAWTYQCVTSVQSCSGTSQFAQTCGSSAACGVGLICCGLPNGPPNPNSQCTGFTTPSKISCALTCSATSDFEVGCNVQTQNCKDSTKTCAVSNCTLPGETLCK